MGVMTLDGEKLRDRLSHVRWIGGGSGAGKSTVADRLSRDHGIPVYSTDDAMSEHAARAAAQDSPLLAEFMAMDMDQRWCARSPGEMLDTFPWYRGEAFGLIVEDLLELPEAPIIVEGFRLLPRLVEPLADPGHAVWLLPTPRLRRAALEARGSLWEIAERTSDPKRALANLLERDRMFTDRLRTSVHACGLPAVEVDTDFSLDAVVTRAAEILGLDG